MGYGSRALELLLDYYSGKLSDPTADVEEAEPVQDEVKGHNKFLWFGSDV
jgi:hypothetical protein